MIVLDTETSGIDPYKHSIISVGAVEFENPSNQFYGECKIWEGAEIMEESLAVNGFSEQEIQDETKQSLEILMIGFLEWAGEIQNRTIAGIHVGYFDLRFLEESAKRTRQNFSFPRGTLDLFSLCYMHMIKNNVDIYEEGKYERLNSRRIYDYVGLVDCEVPHHALEDAKLESEAISRLLYDTTLLPEYKNSAIPWA